MKHLPFPSLGIVILLSCVLAWLAVAQSPESERKSSSDSGDVVHLLTQLVRLQEGVVAAHRQQYLAGQRSEFLAAEIDLSKTRIQLAKERGQAERVLEELQRIVKLHEQRVKRLSHEFEAGAITAVEHQKAEISLLKAQVRLAKARSGEDR